jgi:hypothetical protein
MNTPGLGDSSFPSTPTLLPIPMSNDYNQGLLQSPQPGSYYSPMHHYGQPAFLTPSFGHDYHQQLNAPIHYTVPLPLGQGMEWAQPHQTANPYRGKYQSGETSAATGQDAAAEQLYCKIYDLIPQQPGSSLYLVKQADGTAKSTNSQEAVSTVAGKAMTTSDSFWKWSTLFALSYCIPIYIHAKAHGLTVEPGLPTHSLWTNPGPS